MSADRLIDKLAARQHGVFSLNQARQAGMTDAMVQWRLSIGAWIRLAPSVYAVASAPPTWERQLTAAVLSRPQALVSGTSAAYLLNIDGFRPGRPEITVPTGTSSRSSLARVSRSVWFDELGTVRVGGFKVTNIAETLLKVSERLPIDRTESLIDGLLTSRRLAIDDFEVIRRRVAGARRGAATKLFPLLDLRASDAWEPPINDLERHLDQLVDDPRVPPTTRQHSFRFDQLPMIVDRYIPLWRLILEADGRRWHTRRADFERDRARDNAATAAGEVVLRFTWRMLTTDFEECRRTLLATGESRMRPNESAARSTG